MVAAGAKRGPPPASSGASSAAYKSAPVAPTVGKRVVNGLQALKRAATAVVSAAKGSTTVTASTTASSSVRLASDAGGAHHHRHSAAPSAPLKKLTIRPPSGYTTNVAVMWRRWFCSAPARQALLDQFGAGIKWSAVGGNALNSRSGSITTQTASLNISELSKLHNHCPRLQVALACCRQAEALLATSSLNFVDSDDASSKSSMTAMQPLLRAIVAAVPVVSNSNEGASRRRIFSRFEAKTIIDRVRRVAILTESWDLATRMLPVVRGGEDEEGSAMLFAQKIVQLAQQQSHYLHHLSLQPLFVPSGGHSVAGIQSCSEFDPATRLVLASVLSALEEAATPPPNTWSEESNNRRPSVTTTSSTALCLRSGVSIEINRERTIATAFALCEQHRLFGLPATLRFLRRNKQQTSWAAHSPSTLSKHAKNEFSGDAMLPKEMASSFFPSTRHLPCEWFDIKFHRDGALDLDSTAVDNANTEILKSVLGKEIVSSTAALKDEEGKHHLHHNDGIHFAAIAGDADIMTQLLWEYLQNGQGQHSSQDGDDLTHVEQSNGCSGGGDAEAQPQKEQKWLGKRSKLFAILENEIARNEGADDRAQPSPSSSASASKINIGGKEHAVPRVSATWVPGSVAHHLRYVPPSIGPIAEVRGPHADVYSLAIVFGVMGTSTPAASATHELHNRVFLCSVLELARP